MCAGNAGGRRSDGRLDERAVSDIVGSILLIAITVVMAGVMAALLLSFKGPVDTPHANLAVSVSPGQGGWGTGDESIRVAHLGGDALAGTPTTITYRINSGSQVIVPGSSILSSLQRAGTAVPAQPSWTIGSTWVRTLSLAATDTVMVGVISQQGASTVLATSTLVPGQAAATGGCPFDTSAPTVGAWLQSPSDVTTATVGGVTVTAALIDDCAGVDPAVAPHLFWRINPGTNPVYTDQGAMTSIGGNQWSAAIPATVWALRANQNLEYYVSPVADLDSPVNSGQSQVATDLVDLIQSVTYVTSHTTTTGSYTLGGPFINAQGAGGGTARLQEAAVGQTSPLSLLANPTSSTGSVSISNGLSCSAGASCAFSSNSQFARLDASGDILRVSGFAAPAGALTITQVVIGADVAKVSGDALNPILHLTYSGGPTADPTAFTQTITSTTPANVERTLTGAWTVSHLGTLAVQIDAANGGSIGTGRRLDVDRLYVKVVYTFNGFTVQGQLDWTGVPAGTVQVLDMGGCDAALDTFSVQVWDWTAAAFNTRGTLSGGTCPSFTYTLAATEYQVGQVRVRIVDVTPAGTSQGSLTFDYARVNTI